MRSWEVIEYGADRWSTKVVRCVSLTIAYKTYNEALRFPEPATQRVTLDVVDTSRGYSNRGHLCAQDVVRKRKETA